MDWANFAAKVGRSRERPRSTFFEDEIGKQERRVHRRRNEKDEIEEAIASELDALNIPENYDDDFYR